MNWGAEMEILKIHVCLTGFYRVEGKHQAVNMIPFTGTAEGAVFCGKILPGGVDTQKQTAEAIALSARYMLVGTDSDGEPCRLFIENNGSAHSPADPMVTTPIITTDSKALAWLEDAALCGTVEPEGEGGVLIRIHTKQE